MSNVTPPAPENVSFAVPGAGAASAGPSAAGRLGTARQRRARDGLPPAARQDRAARHNDLALYRQLVQSTDLFPRGPDDPGRRHLVYAAGTGADRIVRFLLEDPAAHGRDMAARTARRALREHEAQGGDAETAERFRDIIQACRDHQAQRGRNPLATLRNMFRRIG